MEEGDVEVTYVCVLVSNTPTCVRLYLYVQVDIVFTEWQQVQQMRKMIGLAVSGDYFCLLFVQ